MQAYAEGFELLRPPPSSASTSPAPVEAWRHGTVIRSWLLDLLARALDEDPGLEALKGWAEDSGEGRWTVRGSRPPGGAGPGHLRRPLRPLRLPPGRVAGHEGDRRPPPAVRRARRRRRERAGRPGPDSADALVLFGATGDLAYKKLFPALYHLGRRVLRRPADHRRRLLRAETTTPCASGPGSRWPPPAFPTSTRPPSAGLTDALGYVSGNYQEPTTYERLAERLKGAEHPMFYLAIPPSLFDDVASGLANAGLADGARVVVEKPFGRDLASAPGTQPRPPPVLPRGGDLPDRPLPRQGGGREPAGLPVRQHPARAGVEPPLRRQLPDHHGRELRHRLPGPVLRGGRRHPRRRPEPPPPGGDAGGHGAAGRRRGRGPARRAGQGPQGHGAGRPGLRRAGPVPRATARRRASPPTPTWRPSPPCALAIESWRWAGVPFYVRAGKNLAASATEVVVEFKQPPRLLFAARRGRAPIPTTCASPSGRRGGHASRWT